MVRVHLRQTVAADVESRELRKLLHHVGKRLSQLVQSQVKVLQRLDPVQVLRNGAV